MVPYLLIAGLVIVTAVLCSAMYRSYNNYSKKGREEASYRGSIKNESNKGYQYMLEQRTERLRKTGAVCPRCGSHNIRATGRRNYAECMDCKQNRGGLCSFSINFEEE